MIRGEQALSVVAGCQHCRRTLADRKIGERCQRAGFAIYAIRGKTTGGGASGEQEAALGIECKGAGGRFGCHMPCRRQTSGSGIDRKTRDTVMAAIDDKQEPS